MHRAVAAALLGSIVTIVPGVADAQPPGSTPLAQRLADTADGFCVDALSRKLASPAPGSAEYARYGLSEGLPQAAMAALGRDGIRLIAGATLASGKASDGAFVVALGGAAGETCRLIVYKAPSDGATETQSAAKLMAKPAGWRSVPAKSPSPAMREQSFLKRDTDQKPYLANILVPTSPNPIPLVIVLSAIPPNVTLPQGY